MKKLTQHYCMIVEEPEKLECGQAVFEGNDSVYIIGFISAVNGREADVILWEPRELEFGENMQCIAESVPDAHKMFMEVIEFASQPLQDWWKEIVRTSCS